MRDFFNQYSRLIFFVLVTTAAAVISTKSFYPDYIIHPDTRTTVGWTSDQVENRKTAMHSFRQRNDTVHVSFTLIASEDVPFPYFILYFNPLATVYDDVSMYDYINITLEADNHPVAAIPVRLQLAIENYSVEENPRTFMIREQSITLEKGVNTYRLPLTEFRTPFWWWGLNPDLSDSLIGEPDYSRFTEVQVCNSYESNGLRQEFTVYRVAFGKNNTVAFSSMLLAAVAFCGTMYELTKIRQLRALLKKQHQPIIDEDTNRLIGYIAEHYHNPELTSEGLQKALNLSEGKVSALLKGYANTTFKKYLNQVRLQEAYRLLSETDRPVSEIALHVGYTSITHFNRVFKESAGCSPNQYRKKLIKKPLKS